MILAVCLIFLFSLSHKFAVSTFSSPIPRQEAPNAVWMHTEVAREARNSMAKGREIESWHVKDCERFLHIEPKAIGLGGQVRDHKVNECGMLLRIYLQNRKLLKDCKHDQICTVQIYASHALERG